MGCGARQSSLSLSALIYKTGIIIHPPQGFYEQSWEEGWVQWALNLPYNPLKQIPSPPLHTGENGDPDNAQGHTGAELALRPPTLCSPFLTPVLCSTSAQHLAHLAHLAPTQAMNENDSPSGVFALPVWAKFPGDCLAYLLKINPLHGWHILGTPLASAYMSLPERLPATTPPIYISSLNEKHGKHNQNQGGWWVGTQRGARVAVILFL